MQRSVSWPAMSCAAFVFFSHNEQATNPISGPKYRANVLRFCPETRHDGQPRRFGEKSWVMDVMAILKRVLFGRARAGHDLREVSAQGTYEAPQPLSQGSLARFSDTTHALASCFAIARHGRITFCCQCILRASIRLCRLIDYTTGTPRSRPAGCSTSSC